MKKKVYFNLDNGIGEILCVVLIVVGGAAAVFIAAGAFLSLINLIL